MKQGQRIFRGIYIKSISYSDILKAKQRLEDKIFNTHFERSRSASEWVGTDVYLKFENQQLTGSFKVRGALNKILFLMNEQKERKKEKKFKGQIKNSKNITAFLAASAGNHAQGVAYASKKVQKPSFIVMPEGSSLVKIKATESYGAEVILRGSSFDEAYKHARFLEKKKHCIFIHPFEDHQIIAGQGTIGVEIFDKISDLDSIVVPIGGGGLISGLALAVKSINRKCKVFGVVLKDYSGMKDLYYQSDPSRTSGKSEILNKNLKERKKKKILFKNGINKGQHMMDSLGLNQFTIADGVAVKKPSVWMYEHYISKYVDDIVSVDEELIAEAVVFLMERAKTVVEASGAMGLAAAAEGKLSLGKKTCIILSGGNIDLNLISKVIEKGLTRVGRIARLNVVTKDQPGVLEFLLNIVAKERVNVLEVKHERWLTHLNLNEVEIQFLLNTFDFKQLKKIKSELRKKGVLVL